MKQNKLSVAFYNLENLFDIEDDPNTLDDDFTPSGKLHWNNNRYKRKLKKLSTVIGQIGLTETGNSPDLLGVAEIENSKVLQDLVSHKNLEGLGYDFVHFESPDERGIDTALLYRKAFFQVVESERVPLLVENAPGVRDYTRDILYVKGLLRGNLVHVLVNHWPSRRAGLDLTESKRIVAAQKNREVVEQIWEEDPNARIIIMGDFNDDPQSVAVREHLVSRDMYNPMVFLLTRFTGSLNHRADWHLFDQIILSPNWMKGYDNPMMYKKSEIFNPYFLTEYKGKFKGNPFRTYAGTKYLGGYSDHFPVYVIFKIKSISDI